MDWATRLLGIQRTLLEESALLPSPSHRVEGALQQGVRESFAVLFYFLILVLLISLVVLVADDCFDVLLEIRLAHFQEFLLLFLFLKPQLEVLVVCLASMKLFGRFRDISLRHFVEYLQLIQ